MVRIVPQLLDGRGDASLHHRQRGRQPDQPVRLQPAQLHGQRQVPGQQEQPLSAFWTYNRKFQPHRGAGAAQPNPINTLHQESPKNLFNGNWTSVMGQNTFLEVSSTYFHMHWPSTWADEFNALPAEPAAAVDVQRHQRHLHRRPRADRPALPRRLPAPDQHRHHALHRRLPRRQPSAEDRLRELVDADRHRRVRDLRRHAPALHRCRPTSATPTVRTGCVPSEVFLYNTPLTQKTKMRNFAGFVQDRASYQRVTLNLGLRWSLLRRHDSGAVATAAASGSR